MGEGIGSGQRLSAEGGERLVCYRVPLRSGPWKLRAGCLETGHPFGGALMPPRANVPQGGEAAVAAVKNAMTGASTAFEQVQKVVKQATEMAESNFKAVTATATKAAKAK